MSVFSGDFLRLVWGGGPMVVGGWLNAKGGGVGVLGVCFVFKFCDSAEVFVFSENHFGSGVVDSQHWMDFFDGFLFLNDQADEFFSELRII